MTAVEPPAGAPPKPPRRRRATARRRRRWLEPREPAELGPHEVEHGLRLLLLDGVSSQVMGALTGGALLVAFALKLGASNKVIGLIAAVALASSVHFIWIARVAKLDMVRKHNMMVSYLENSTERLSAMEKDGLVLMREMLWKDWLEPMCGEWGDQIGFELDKMGNDGPKDLDLDRKVEEAKQSFIYEGA